MVRVESSKIIESPQEKIFAVIKDIDRLPELFPARYKSMKILERSDGHLLTEETIVMASMEIHQKVKHTIEPNRMVRSEVMEGDTKGTIVTNQLSPRPESSTEIKIDADLKLGKLGSILRIFAKGKIKKEIEHMIGEFDKSIK
jgi:ribosome-associated toxin RatA of RatAB toxin-antitoxin module